MVAFLLHSISSTSKTHAAILPVALLQLVPAPRVLTPATWGRHDHVLTFIICYATAGPQPLLRLTHSPQSLGNCTIPWAPSSFSFSPSFLSSLHYHLPQPGLLKSAAIKTDAGLKCHKCISNCQNINLFTLSCLAFLRVRGVG